MFLFCSLMVALMAMPGFAQEGELDKSEPKGTTPQEIIQRFAAKEKEFKEARDQYTFRQSVKVQVLDGNTVKGEYQQVFDDAEATPILTLESNDFHAVPTLKIETRSGRSRSLVAGL